MPGIVIEVVVEVEVRALGDALLAASGRSVDEADRDALERELRAQLTLARAAFPRLDVAPAAFMRHVAAHLPTDGPVGAALATLRVSELYLACGCHLGIPAAHRAFDDQFLREGRLILGRAGAPFEADEFLQALRDRLLVRDGNRPARIAGFSGRGELRNWVRIAAQRLVVDEFRKRRPVGTDPVPDAVDTLRSGAADPELAVLQETYRAHFQAAFDRAFARLEPATRTLLRYRYVDGLDVAQIAVIDGRHRVSISRALGKARDHLLEMVRRELVETLAVGRSEADSLIRLLRSRVEVSFGRLLCATTAAASSGD